MGVQKVILTRVPSAEKIGGKDVEGGVGTLALGKPGDIVSKAFGPLVYGEIAGDEAVEFGTFVAGKGLLVNSNDTPFYNTEAGAAPFGTTNKAMPGQTVAFMTYGTAIVKKANIAAVAAGMNARVVTPGYDAETAADDGVFEVEVTGFKA